MELVRYDYVVVGAGFFGSIVARRIAEELGEKVLVIDKKNHIGGNSYAYIDKETGIEVHKYGSHIFHTSDENVWSYLNRFTEFNNYRHTVYSNYKNVIYSLPINLHTINQYFQKDLSPTDAQALIKKEVEEAQIVNPKNLEEKAISLIGKSLYEAFIKGYTKKQWSKDPKDLVPEIITRLPVRFNYDNSYFSDKYQGIPKDGYEKMFNNILNHKNIELKLNTSFNDIKDKLSKKMKVVYTGPIDELCDYQFGVLPWRSLRFEVEVKKVDDFQGTAVINYADKDVPFTRIHEFKHYHPDWKNSDSTVVCKEYSENYEVGKEPYYPVNNPESEKLYQNYLNLAKQKFPNFVFGGRLGCYKYWDMDKAVLAALNLTFPF